MIDASKVLASLQREFPAPRIDPAWIQACAQALADDNQEPSLHNIREQFLFSDLSSSTLPSNLIPPEAHQTLLFPTPTLVQLVSITEIGHSAFQLQTIQEQRKDVLSGVTRIRRMDDEEEELDEGKLPAYPRGMLKLRVTDGERVIEALEYQRLPGIKLAETPLGAKLVLHEVKALRAILMLTPGNTQFLGYEVAHLEAQQPVQFTNSLLERMGKPLPGEDEAPRQPRPAQTARRLTLPPAAPTAAVRPRPAPAPPIASPYFQPRNAASSSRTVARAPVQAIDDDDSFYDDSFIRQIDAAEARATLGSNSRVDQSSDYGLDDDFDPDILGHLDEVEKQARRRSTAEDEIEWTDNWGSRGSAASTRRKRKARVNSDEKENWPDVIEVSD